MKSFITEMLFLLVSFVILELAFNLIKLVISLVIAKVLGLEIAEIGFLFFKGGKNEQGKLSFKITKAKALVYCTIKESVSIIKRGAFYLAPHIVCLIGITVFVLNINVGSAFSDYAFMVFVAGLLAVVSEIINFVRLVKAFLATRPSAKVEKFNRDMLLEINQGVRPRDFKIVDFKPYTSDGLDASYLAYLYLKFCYYLENQNFVDLKPIINAFVNNMPKEFTEVYTLQAYSLLFYYSYIDLNPVLANNYYYYVENQILKDSDANSFRVYAYYLYFVKNDKQKAYDTAMDGLKLCDKMPDKGFSFMERDLLEHLIEIINTNGGFSPLAQVELNAGFSKSFS